MKFKFKFNLKREIKIAGVLLVVLLLIAFTERKQGSVSIQNVQIKIDNTVGNHFMDESDVNHLMQLKHENLRGASLDKVGLKEIEKKIMQDRFVKDAQLYTDLKGNLVVNVELRRPIARIVRNDGPDGYIAEDGTVMSVSEKFTSRVILISGSYVRNILRQENINSTEEGKQLMEMIELIRKDDFWSAQMTQLDIDSKTRINIIPEVGNETIEFGKPENIEAKFKKLKIFYKEIIPTKGWGKYKRVNLEFEGQIVAE